MALNDAEILKMKFDQDVCLKLWYDPIGYFGKMNSTLGSVVPLAMFVFLYFDWIHVLFPRQGGLILCFVFLSICFVLSFRTISSSGWVDFMLCSWIFCLYLHLFVSSSLFLYQGVVKCTCIFLFTIIYFLMGRCVLCT